MADRNPLDGLTEAVHRGLVRICRHEVTTTHAGKVLFSEDGITKRYLVDRYCRIAPWIQLHLRDRPLAMERYPDGIDKPGLFQKAAPFYYPAWIKTVTVKKIGGTVQHVVCDDAATLVYLAN